jgi:hypothetical protein
MSQEVSKSSLWGPSGLCFLKSLASSLSGTFPCSYSGAGDRCGESRRQVLSWTPNSGHSWRSPGVEVTGRVYTMCWLASQLRDNKPGFLSGLCHFQPVSPRQGLSLLSLSFFINKMRTKQIACWYGAVLSGKD